MRVLHILNTSKFSGAENVVCQIISMFNEDKDYEMIYCSLDGSIREALSERGIWFESIESMTVSQLKAVIQKTKPDVIHAHDMRAGFIAAYACKNIPLISHIHNNSFDSRGISLKAIAYSFAAMKAKHIFWVSRSAYEGYFFHALYKKKSSVLYNIINVVSLYERMSQDAKTYNYDVIYLGRLSREKDPYRLLDICKLLVEKNKQIKIAIVGSGEMEDEIKATAIEMNLLNNVSFLGFQSNPTKILHDSKVMIMTSLWEGTPMCALEAQALGVPIVSTPVDGLKDLVTNYETGLLSDDNNCMVEAILELIDNKEKHMLMSKKAHSFSIDYNNIDKYKNQLKLTYNDAVNQ